MKRTAAEALTESADAAPAADATLAGSNDAPATAAAPSAAPSAIVDRYVLISCTDKLHEYCELDTQILEEVQPKLFKKIKYDKPSIDPQGRRFWRCGMHQALFHSYQRSLLVGRLVVGEGTNVEELLATMEEEGVVISPPDDDPVHFARLKAPRAGVLDKRLHDVPLRVYLEKLAEQVATALCRWPKLADVLRIARKHGSTHVSMTSSRCWVSFEAKPCIEPPQAGRDKRSLNCERFDKWLKVLLTHIGIVRHRLIKAGDLQESEHDAEHFRRLTGAIRSDMLGPLFFITDDFHKRTSEQEALFALGRRFATKIRDTVTGSANEGDHALNKFANGIVAFAIQLMEALAPMQTDFSSDTCDEEGNSPERALLTAALRQRRIQVVRWNDGMAANLDTCIQIRPLSFPGLNDMRSTRTSVLLDFTKV